MGNEENIAIDSFCSYHNIDLSFVQLLQEQDLIRVYYIESRQYISREELQQLEKFVRLYHDLNINPEGIDALTHMMERIHRLQDEINILKARLKIYE